MTESDHPAIIQMSKEFEHHIATAAATTFYSTSEANEAFGRLTRELETKRQLGSLTAAEKMWLSEIDDLVERIAKFNRATASAESRGPLVSTEQKIYDLKESKLFPAREQPQPAFTPKVTQDVASKIVDDLNKQFQEKILSKLDTYEKFSFPPSASENVSGTPDGRNLIDYISSLRGNLPNLPFSDGDSHFDLSKMTSKKM